MVIIEENSDDDEVINCSFVRSFIHSFVRSFVLSFVRSLPVEEGDRAALPLVLVCAVAFNVASNDTNSLSLAACFMTITCCVMDMDRLAAG